MNRPLARGWCPGAWRPMVSGDGLIVRLRPRLGRFTVEQVLAVCAAAVAHGAGILEFTRRANLQLRGVREAEHSELLEALARTGALDAGAAEEARRNVLVAPLWRSGDATFALAEELTARIGEVPDVPAKFGFAVDAGDAPVLWGASADVRIERGASGGLILRADGMRFGRRVRASDAVDAALELARSFLAQGGARAGRMKRLVEAGGLSPDARACEAPAPSGAPLVAGTTPLGPVVGAPFGQVAASDLAALVRDSGARAIRLTPWRLILLEGGRTTASPGFSGDADDPLLRVDACPGAGACENATVETRALAARLAREVSGSLHVSGCAKGCARSGSATVTLIGRDGAFDLVRDGGVCDAPMARGLAPGDVLASLREIHAPHL